MSNTNEAKAFYLRESYYIEPLATGVHNQQMPTCKSLAIVDFGSR